MTKFCGFFLLSLFFSQVVSGSSAILMGVVTGSSNGSPVIGAKISLNGQVAYSTFGGVYSLAISPAGTFPVSCSKPGFQNYTSNPVVLQPGITSILNIVLDEKLNSPLGVQSYLDTVNQIVPVSWSPPSGDYEILYDDGIQDNFTVWSFGGNMNAVKFSPSGYPLTVSGGSVYVGTAANYPSGSNPLVPFQIQIFDAGGTGGTPGISIAGPFNVVPTALGWVEFSFPVPVSVNNGPFFMVMIQGGNAPNASGIAIDETYAQFRSYSRFVTGNGPWFPSGGNFMMRARCIGPGGPPYLSDNPAVVSFYNVYRLRQGEEQNNAAWSLVGSTLQPGITDSSWNALPCGPYRWGVKAGYPGNRWSAVSFSNVIGKCWTVPVTFQLTTSCEPSNPGGAVLRLVNLAYPDTSYQTVADSIGNISFAKVWKGTYKLTVTKFGYDTLNQTLSVINPYSASLNLMQVKMPPENLTVNDSSLMARWDVPRFSKQLFSENWDNGSFSINNWTTDPGTTNWSVSANYGNPAPSATFSSLPFQTNYAHALVSKTIHGARSTLLKLRYDIFLDNYGTTSMNQLAVEIWDGNSWTNYKNYTNESGNIPWTSDDLDISSVTDGDFKFRFRAYGVNSQDINKWNIDNISVVASEPAQEQANCILGYYFYLGNVITGYTTKNAFPIPPELIQYGQTYNACVRALYGSGYSDFSCTDFNSAFLYPVRNLQGNPVENIAFVSWEKPTMTMDTTFATPPGLIGYLIYRNDSLIGQINNPDSLFFYDYNLDPGLYKYGITANYELTAYGIPGQFAQSLPAGPLHITITWGRQIPFLESWNSSSFSFNEWTFNNGSGNWIIDQTAGNPAPSASFRWQPPLVGYDVAMESPALNGLAYNCAAVWLDFDIKLKDRNATGAEKIIVDVLYNNTWHKKAEFKNLGDIAWTSSHLDISPVRGKGFRIRFRAVGQNSADIVEWLIDNIYIYPVCYPAENLSAENNTNVVKLTWSPPVCHSGNLLMQGFETALFPPAQWTEINTNLVAGWSQFSINSTLGVHSGNFSAGVNWDYNHQDEWLIAENVYVSGNLSFWSYAFQGSLHLDHYFVKVSTDHGATWDILLDLSALPPYPGPNGINDWNSPYLVDLSSYYDQTVDIAWHAVDGDGNGLWYPWAIDDCSVGVSDQVIPGALSHSQTRRNLSDSRSLEGYDIYRFDKSTVGFLQINQVPLADTVYYDTIKLTGQYEYFVHSRYSECEYTSNSDTITVGVIAGFHTPETRKISVFPNPADEFLKIQGDDPILAVEIIGTDGKIAKKWNFENQTEITIKVKDVQAGFYMLNIQSDHHVFVFKLCIVHDNDR